MTTGLASLAARGRIGRDDATQLATIEYTRLFSLLRALEQADWQAATDCAAWDVRALVSHLVGAAESCSYREQIRVARAGLRLAKADAVPVVDGINAIQVRERSSVEARRADCPAGVCRAAICGFSCFGAGSSAAP
jgi:Mycothiol maleylpyruvate isomerase N-terminal domain